MIPKNTGPRDDDRLLTVLDSLDALVYVADFHSYEILYLNKFGRDTWGDLVKRKCWESLQKGQEGPCSFCTNDRLVSGTGMPTGVYQREFQNTLNGKWYDCRDQAIRWIDGRLVHLEIAFDITERKQAEETVSRERDFTQTVLDSLPGLFYLFDDQGRFLRWNKNLETVSGYSNEEIAHLSPLDFFGEPDKEIVANRIREVFLTGEDKRRSRFLI